MTPDPTTRYVLYPLAPDAVRRRYPFENASHARAWLALVLEASQARSTSCPYLIGIQEVMPEAPPCPHCGQAPMEVLREMVVSPEAALALLTEAGV